MTLRKDVAALIVLVLAACTYVEGALADRGNDPSALARKLLETADAESILDRVPEEMLNSHVRRYPARAAVAKEIKDFYTRKIDREAIELAVVAELKSKFTAEELIQLDSFFQTEAGKKLLGNFYLLGPRGYQLAQKQVRKLDHEAEEFIARLEIEKGAIGKYGAQVQQKAQYSEAEREQKKRGLSKFYFEQRKRLQALEALKQQGKQGQVK